MLKHIFSKLPRKSLSNAESLDSSDPFIQKSSSSSGRGAAAGALKRASSSVFPASVITGFEPLVPFKDVPSSVKMNLFISKLSLCCVVFDFTNPNRNSSEKELKRATLIELVDFVSSNTLRYSEPAILVVCKMCAVNLFRVFPPNYRSKNSSSHASENDDGEPAFDPAWSHLQFVYDLLLKFVTSYALEAKVTKKYLNHSFIVRLLELFDTEDPRERDCLKAVLHSIYGKFMVHRPFIRRSMSNLFHRFVFETEKHNGIAELLEVFGSVITGFALPLKEEHKIFLWRALLPLHKPQSLGVYYQQLSYCVTQFLEKDPKLASSVVQGLLKYWPITNSQKEVMFLSELEEILEAIDVAEFQKVMVPLFWRIRCCISSYHFQVAERALFLWNNDQIVNLIAHYRHVILPIIFPALENNVQSHWNQAVLNLTLNVRSVFKEMDDALFLACHARYKEKRELNLTAEKRRKVWEHLESAASLKPIAENIAVLVTPLAASIRC